jgi:hypothetical protein
MRKQIRSTVIGLIITITGLCFAAPVQAQSPTALQIIENVYHRPEGTDRESKLLMTLTNSRGDQRVREIRQFSRNANGMEKKIMFFISPADVRNTAFMSWSYEQEGKADDQWIYLPALKRTKRIASDNKSDYFMGSDFTYDDLGDRHPSADRHQIIGEETIKGETCYIVESVSLAQDYQYSRTVSWISRDKWLGLKKEFYDPDGERLKTLNVEKFEEIDGYWIILHSRMHHVQKQHTTDMQLSEVVIDSGISDQQFTERMMKRGL